ncbi:MAG: hypothetical protein LBN11_00525 [Tannerella sp.]|jgi:hypothetical protein|nr:hypothetical protein [Tannerella sp.]
MLLAERNEWERRYRELAKQGIASQARNDELQTIVVPVAHVTETINNEQQTATTLYADAITDGYFSRVKETPNEDSVFEVHLQNAQTATFTVYQSAYQRIIANPSFLEGCDKQVLNSAQTVEIVSKGTAQKQMDGKWQITKKLNVIIN